MPQTSPLQGDDKDAGPDRIGQLRPHEVDEAADAIQQRWSCVPRVGIILGTGLGDFADQIDREETIPYNAIPHFPRSTAVGHKGQLCCGTLKGTPVMTMEGRFHRYEGYSLSHITLPVRVMHRLGVECLIVSNASGGMHPHYRTGDVMLIEDHINLMWDGPLIGVNDASFGPRFPDLSRPYDPDLIERALAIARREDFVAHKGTYLALTGPNYETRAEYRMYRQLGADVVGMSTVPEVIVANQIGMRVLALSTVTNVCFPDDLSPTDGDEVVAAAAAAQSKLRAIVTGIVREVAAAG